MAGFGRYLGLIQVPGGVSFVPFGGGGRTQSSPAGEFEGKPLKARCPESSRLPDIFLNYEPED
jgi:hypothetical protein